MCSFPYLEPVCCFMSNSNCCFLTCIQVSQQAGCVARYSPLFQNFLEFAVAHTVKGFGLVNKAEVDVFFLELSWFFDDPMDVGNLISGSSSFYKSSLNIWNFMVHILWKTGLENFEHYLLVCEMSAMCSSFNILCIVFLWDWNENWPFPVLWPLLSFPNLLAYLVQNFHNMIF